MRQTACCADRVCSDDGSVDRPDRRPDHQVGVDAEVTQCLQHSHLLGAEASAASKHEPDGLWE
ncbi:MAG: hypothetical protein R2789_02245 [Microthrixaceae bacterium]